MSQRQRSPIRPDDIPLDDPPPWLLGLRATNVHQLMSIDLDPLQPTSHVCSLLPRPAPQSNNASRSSLADPVQHGVAFDVDPCSLHPDTLYIQQISRHGYLGPAIHARVNRSDLTVASNNKKSNNTRAENSTTDAPVIGRLTFLDEQRQRIPYISNVNFRKTINTASMNPRLDFGPGSRYSTQNHANISETFLKTPILRFGQSYVDQSSYLEYRTRPTENGYANITLNITHLTEGSLYEQAQIDPSLRKLCDEIIEKNTVGRFSSLVLSVRPPLRSSDWAIRGRIMFNPPHPTYATGLGVDHIIKSESPAKYDTCTEDSGDKEDCFTIHLNEEETTLLNPTHREPIEIMKRLCNYPSGRRSKVKSSIVLQPRSAPEGDLETQNPSTPRESEDNAGGEDDNKSATVLSPRGRGKQPSRGSSRAWVRERH